MGAFEDLHGDRVIGSLAMFDRMIFKGRLTALYKQNGAKCFLWTQGVALKDFTGYAKWTTATIADNVRRLAGSAGRPVISFDHVKTRNYAQRKDDLAHAIAERDGIEGGDHLRDQRGRDLHELPGAQELQDQDHRDVPARAQVPAPLPLPDRSRVRLHAHPTSKAGSPRTARSTSTATCATRRHEHEQR